MLCIPVLMINLPACLPGRSLVASKYRKYGVYKDARTILAIHNLSHQVSLITTSPDR